jgi:ArsR family metal-binding transcriptional regulator
MMLLQGYTIRIVLPECNPSAQTVNAIAELSDDISQVLPYLNAIIKGCTYHPEAGVLRVIMGGKAITFRSKQIAVSNLEDEAEARQVLERIRALINRTYERRQEIEPSYKKGTELKLFEVYKLLPGTNCQRCGEPTCLAFASKLVKQMVDLDSCKPLWAEEHRPQRESLLKMLEAAGYR